MRSFINHSLNQRPVFQYDATSRLNSETSPTTSGLNSDSFNARAAMDVNGPGSVHRTNPLSNTRPSVGKTAPAGAKPIETTDKLEISSAGEMLDQLNQSGNLQTERLAQIKSAIDAGTYETPEKLEAALSKMLDEISGEQS